MSKMISVHVSNPRSGLGLAMSSYAYSQLLAALQYASSARLYLSLLSARRLPEGYQLELHVGDQPSANRKMPFSVLSRNSKSPDDTCMKARWPTTAEHSVLPECGTISCDAWLEKQTLTIAIPEKLPAPVERHKVVRNDAPVRLPEAPKPVTVPVCFYFQGNVREFDVPIETAFEMALTAAEKYVVRIYPNTRSKP